MKSKQTARKAPARREAVAPPPRQDEEAPCFFMLSLSVPRRVADWVRAEARAQGHGDISQIVRQALDRLVASEQTRKAV